MDQNMESSSIINAFRALPAQEKVETLVRLSHELTILARDTYQAGTLGLLHPARLRAINEVQHRITAHVLALLRNDADRYPDDVLVNIILEHDDDLELRRQIGEAFSRVVACHAAV
jgi:hypothetical protein